MGKYGAVEYRKIKGQGEAHMHRTPQFQPSSSPVTGLRMVVRCIGPVKVEYDRLSF